MSIESGSFSHESGNFFKSFSLLGQNAAASAISSASWAGVRAGVNADDDDDVTERGDIGGGGDGDVGDTGGINIGDSGVIGESGGGDIGDIGGVDTGDIGGVDAGDIAGVDAGGADAGDTGGAAVDFVFLRRSDAKPLVPSRNVTPFIIKYVQWPCEEILLYLPKFFPSNPVAEPTDKTWWTFRTTIFRQPKQANRKLWVITASFVFASENHSTNPNTYELDATLHCK